MLFISETEVESLLNWDNTYRATEASIRAVSEEKGVVGRRVFTQIPNTPKWMLTMPGFLQDPTYGAWACKLLTGNPENSKLDTPLPNLNANVMLLDENTGILKAIISGTQITNWRTAAASAVATKYLLSPTTKPQKVLSIFGCGEQGKAHAECFYHLFNFEEIRLWNRTTERATNLAKELNQTLKTTKFKAFVSNEDCSRGADVIITATSPGNVPIVRYDWLKKGIHINAVGVTGSGSNIKERHFELDQNTYKHAQVYVDSWATANSELTILKQFGADIKAEVGEVILGNVPTPSSQQLTIFQSLGMAVEDCAMARMIYDLYIQKQDNKSGSK